MAQNTEWRSSAKNTKVENRSNPLIRTKTQPIEDVRVNSTKEPGKNPVNIVNLELPLASGRHIVDKNTGELDETRRASSAGVIAFDIGDMTTKDKDYPGSTEAGTPAMLHEIKDGVNTNVYFELDATAIAHKSFDRKQENRKEKGLAFSADPKDPNKINYKDPNRDRIDVMMTKTTTHNGVAGIAKDGVTKNVAEIASQAYLLSSGSKTRENPELGAYSKKTVDDISKLFKDTYDNFVSSYATKECKGIPARDENGNAKSDIIPGTAFPSLKDLGIKVVKTKDGMTTLAMDKPYNAQEAQANGGTTLGQHLAAMNKAFNSVWSQTVNSTYSKDNKDVKAERTLGNMVGLNSYAVAAYDGDNKLTDLGLIQPAMTANMQPYASALTKSVNVATHNFQMTVDGELVKDATPSQAYGEGVINKANEIMNYGSEGTGGQRTREEAKEVQAKQLNEIYKAVNGKDAELPSITEASKEAQDQMNK